MSANRIMIGATVLIFTIGCLGLTGCAPAHTPQPIVTTQEVDVPVSTMAAPPKELRRSPLAATEIPTVVAPGTPGVSSCLLPAGEDRLRHAISTDHQLLGGWEAWTTQAQ